MPRYFRFIVIVLLVMVMTTSSFAQYRRLGFFLNFAGYFPSQENISSGYGTGLGGVFFFNPKVSVSFEWKYSRFDVQKQEGKLLDGTLTVTPLLASIHYNFTDSESFAPYVFGGAGLFFSSFRLDERIDLEEANIRSQDISNGLGLYGGIGSIFQLNERLSLFLEGLYLWRTATGTTNYFIQSPSTTFDINLSSFSILIGLEYFY